MQGEFVIEYVGEIIDNSEYENRRKEHIGSYYYLTLDSERMIDARRKGKIIWAIAIHLGNLFLKFFR